MLAMKARSSSKNPWKIAASGGDPIHNIGMWISGWNGGTKDDHLDLFQNGGV